MDHEPKVMPSEQEQQHEQENVWSPRERGSSGSPVRPAPKDEPQDHEHPENHSLWALSFSFSFQRIASPLLFQLPSFGAVALALLFQIVQVRLNRSENVRRDSFHGAGLRIADTADVGTAITLMASD